MSGIGLGIRVGGAGGGSGISTPSSIAPDAIGAVAQLRAGIKGPVTWSKLSGASTIAIAAATGVVSVSAALGESGSASAIIRAANADGDAVERRITLKARAVAPTPTPGVARMAAPVDVTPAKAAQYPLFVTADVDPGNERDDEGADALWLATQDHFKIVGMVASAPDGLASGYNNQIDAYEADRTKVITHTPFPERFQTGDQLKSLVVQGPRQVSPSAGYRVLGNNEYDRATAASQALIAAAAANANPNSELPQDKLWVLVQGSFDVIAQAAYEAIQLGQQPDFFKRIRVIGQPNFNSGPNGDTNSWRYLVQNCWPAANTPGMFGDFHLIAGYFQWHAFNRESSADSSFWNERVAPRGAMGAFMVSERQASNYPATNFRAGDGGAWFWLMSAKLQGNFDPTNAANWCGKYRSYVGEKWAAQTFGYGAVEQTSLPNPEHTWFNPHAWAPELTVNNTGNAAINAVDLDVWYGLVGEAFERYGATKANVPSMSRMLDQSVAPLSNADALPIVDEWVFTEAADAQVFTGRRGGWLRNGTTDAAVDAGDVTPNGQMVAIGTGDLMRSGPLTRVSGSNKRMMVSVVRLAAVSGLQNMLSRDDGGTRQFQFRFNAGKTEYIRRYGGGTSATTITGTGALAAATWAMISVYEDGTNVQLFRDGVADGTGTVGGTPNVGTSAIIVGAHRSGSSVSASLNGDMAYQGFFDNVTDIAAVHSRVRALVAAKGITIP